LADVAAGADGTYLLTWTQASTGITNAYARLVDTSGQPIGAQLLVGGFP
jgi:hypothetical protein